MIGFDFGGLGADMLLEHRVGHIAEVTQAWKTAKRKA
jgi:hypothetical protein